MVICSKHQIANKFWINKKAEFEQSNHCSGSVEKMHLILRLENHMNRNMLWSLIGAVTLVPSVLLANQSVQDAIANPDNFAIWGGNYAGQRYSE